MDDDLHDAPREKEIREVMRMSGCDRRAAQRALRDAMCEVRAAYVLLLDALRKGEVQARGTNTKTGKVENIPKSAWR